MADPLLLAGVLLACFVVYNIGGSKIVIILSGLGVPASFVVVATVCIVGLGWGRSTHAVSIAEAVRGETSPDVSLDALIDGNGHGPSGGEASVRSASRRVAVAPQRQISLL